MKIIRYATYHYVFEILHIASEINFSPSIYMLNWHRSMLKPVAIITVSISRQTSPLESSIVLVVNFFIVVVCVCIFWESNNHSQKQILRRNYVSRYLCLICVLLGIYNAKRRLTRKTLILNFFVIFVFDYGWYTRCVTIVLPRPISSLSTHQVGSMPPC